jgi:hypothetical protein
MLERDRRLLRHLYCTLRAVEPPMKATPLRVLHSKIFSTRIQSCDGIVGKNNATTGPDIRGAVVADHSFISNTAGSTIAGTNNVLNVDPLLGPLADNGGPTQTHALLPGSPATNVAALANDRRGSGYARIVGIGIDFGAFEVQTIQVKVASVQVNAGAAQRSRVTTLKITFDQVVIFFGSPQLRSIWSDRVTANIRPWAQPSTMAPPFTIVTLTFLSGDTVDFGSLAGSHYTLTIDACKVSNIGGPLDGNGDGTGGGNYMLASVPAPNPPTNIFRLFADINGDGAVANNDFVVFRQYFTGYLFALDFDGDGAVIASDFNHLACCRGHFGVGRCRRRHR